MIKKKSEFMSDCQICVQIQKKENILYEDPVVVIFIPQKPACHGHLVITPKKHSSTLDSITDAHAQHLFFAANYAASALFQTVECQGTNILCSTGNIYKEDQAHLALHVLSRTQTDGITLSALGKQGVEKDLTAMQKKIKEKTDFIGTAKPEKQVINLDDKPLSLETKKKQEPKNHDQNQTSVEQKNNEHQEKDSEENYLVKQLKRIP